MGSGKEPEEVAFVAVGKGPRADAAAAAGRAGFGVGSVEECGGRDSETPGAADVAAAGSDSSETSPRIVVGPEVDIPSASPSQKQTASIAVHRSPEDGIQNF